jgi:dolichol-phosphate mannosyltransferase
MQNSNLALSIVLPTYKERENLETFIPDIEKGFSNISFEIVVVDDNSKDGTSELIEKFKQEYGNIQIIERSGLLGIGSALREGYNKAKGEYILSSDADLSFSVKDMQALLEKIKQGHDMVLGYKVPLRDAKSGFKDYGSAVGNWIVRLVTRGSSLKNFNTNFRIFKNSLWKQLSTLEDRNFFLFETILKAKKNNADIAEIPVTFYDRKFGTTKLNFFKEGPRYFYKLIKYTFFSK